MADLQNITYGEQAFTIPAYDDTALSERVEHIEGLQTEHGRAIGDLNELTTTAKDSLVNAVNEVNKKTADLHLKAEMDVDAPPENMLLTGDKEMALPPTMRFEGTESTLTYSAETEYGGMYSIELASKDYVDSKAGGGFVAEYQVTTAQEVIDYLDGGGTAPIVVKRGNDYYTAIMTQKVNDTRVMIRALGTLSGSYYVFTYTINGSTWSNAIHGLQNLLVSGTNIKTINGQTVLGSGDLSV